MADSGDDKNKYKIFNFGYDDDDDFVVPDHIKDILNEVHGSKDAEQTQSPQENPPSEPQDKIITFEEREEDIYMIPPQNPNPSVQEPIDEIKVETTSVTVDDRQNPPEKIVRQDISFIPSLREDPQGLRPEGPQPQEPVREEFRPQEVQFQQEPQPEPPREEPQTTDTEPTDLGFSSLPPRRSESIFDKPLQEKHEEPKIKLPKKKSLRPFKKIMAVLVLGLIGLSSTYYGFSLYSNQSAESKKVLGTSQSSVDDIVKAVAALVELSSAGEQPTEIANVEDVGKLSNNAFFDRAKNGDMILIYSRSKIAVLFRPATGRVIAIGPVDPSAGPSPTATPAPAEDEIVIPTISVSPTKKQTTSVSTGSAEIDN